MVYGLYKNVRNSVWQVFIDFNITKLPVSLNQIVKRIGVKVIKNSDIQKLKKGERGATICINGNWYIVFDDNESVPVCRFTVAHELGHILLEHTMEQMPKYRTFEIRDENEQSADMFAIRLLAPACVLHELQAFSPEQIQQLCNISYSASVNRAERMKELETRNKYYLHPLERQVRKQFEQFINEYRSKM